MSLWDRLQHSWDAFTNKDPTRSYRYDLGPSYSRRPDRMRFTGGNERTIMSSIYTRLAIDATSIKIQHCRVDKNDNFMEAINSNLNKCFNRRANLDQTGRAFIQDAIMSMFDEGVIALVPVVTDINPDTGSFDILELRVGKVVEWYPEHVKLSVYNEKTAQKQEMIWKKSSVALIENPYYAVMNEPNSTLQRLKHKLALLDSLDEKSSSGKLDMIIQLPYSLKSETKIAKAKERTKDIEVQLSGSKYGIAYIDSTEHITQLNRPLENNLLPQIESLRKQLYSELGLTEEIMNGSAEPKVMNNYFSRTIEPIVSALIDEMATKFLTKTALTQGQSIKYFRNPFKMVPPADLAELADKFTRSEIVTSNEFRQVIGLYPAADPNADVLRNKNLSQPADAVQLDINGEVVNEGTQPQEYYEEEENVNE